MRQQNFLDITVRLSAGSYLATCPGHRDRASSAQSAECAAQRLAAKLYPAAEVVETVTAKPVNGDKPGAVRCYLRWREGV